MEYKKKFNKDKTKVTIKMQDDNELWDLDNKTLVKSKTFKVIKASNVYKKIKKGKPIDISGQYIEDFSLSEYRKKYNIESEKLVALKKFNAEGSFFEGGVDFSYAFFGEEDASFEHANFGKGYVSFVGANFGKGIVNFAHATFGDGDVEFKDVTFGEGDVFFWGSNFGKGDISFEDANFGKGDVSFENANFGKGDVFFWDATFGKGNVSFMNANFGKWNVDFVGTNFGDGIIDFTSLKVQGDWDMRGIKANIINFSGSLIHGTINLTVVKIDRLKLINTQLTGKIFISSKELRIEKGLKQKKDAINIQEKETTHTEKRDQFVC